MFDTICPHCGGVVESTPVVAKPAPRRSAWPLAILIPYSLLMTVVAITGFLKSQTQIHPLEMLPDYGDHKGSTKKGASQTMHLPPADLPLPRHLITKIGQQIVVGDLSFTPTQISTSHLLAMGRLAGREGIERRPPTKEAALVMQADLQNVSTDITFFPMDPFLLRKPKSQDDRVFTMLESGGRKWIGGPLTYEADHSYLQREWIEGQDDDDKPLQPGESRKTCICSAVGDGLVRDICSNEPVLWRVHVHRGMTEHRGRQVPVSAVIGVEFMAADVKVLKNESKQVQQSGE